MFHAMLIWTHIEVDCPDANFGQLWKTHRHARVVYIVGAETNIKSFYYTPPRDLPMVRLSENGGVDESPSSSTHNVGDSNMQYNIKCMTMTLITSPFIC